MTKRDFKIMEEDHDWFLRSTYPISYELVICYSLLNYLSKNEYDNKEDDNKEEGRKVLKAFKKAVDDRTYFYNIDFFEVVRLQDDKDFKGLVIVDKSKGVYPLILYAGPETGREGAFTLCLRDVVNKYDAVFELSKEENIRDLPKDWTKNFQKKLVEQEGFGSTSSAA